MFVLIELICIMLTKTHTTVAGAVFRRTGGGLGEAGLRAPKSGFFLSKPSRKL